MSLATLLYALRSTTEKLRTGGLQFPLPSTACDLINAYASLGQPLNANLRCPFFPLKTNWSLNMSDPVFLGTLTFVPTPVLTSQGWKLSTGKPLR